MREISNTIKNLKPGDIFWDDHGYKCHVVVNLKKEHQIVFKFYGKRKQWWHYSVESYFWFEIRLTEIKDGKTVGLRKPMKIKKSKTK